VLAGASDRHGEAVASRIVAVTASDSDRLSACDAPASSRLTLAPARSAMNRCSATEGRVSPGNPVLIQPMAADDVASAVRTVTLSPPANSSVEIAGPQQFRLHELVRRALSERHDPREVVADPHALYFGTELHERTLLPAADAQLAQTPFDDWLSQANARS
jgi:uncharacterized protein YbjT (DUF2867 family)